MLSLEIFKTIRFLCPKLKLLRESEARETSDTEGHTEAEQVAESDVRTKEGSSAEPTGEDCDAEMTEAGKKGGDPDAEMMDDVTGGECAAAAPWDCAMDTEERLGDAPTASPSPPPWLPRPSRSAAC